MSGTAPHSRRAGAVETHRKSQRTDKMNMREKGRVMNKQIRTIGVLIFALVGLMSFSGGAYAAGQDLDNPQAVERLVREVERSADPYAAYDQLTPTEQSAFDEHLKVASVEVVSESTSGENAAGSAANGCGSNSYEVKGMNLVGYTVWKFSTRTTWCWNGTEITNAPHFTTDGDVYYLFWSYEGTTYEEEKGGEGDWMHQDSAEGEFKYCVGPGGIGCIQSAYPDIHKTQYGDGQKSATGGQ